MAKQKKVGPLPQAEKDLITKYFASGKSAEWIAARVNRNVVTVNKLLTPRGRKVEKKTKKRSTAWKAHERRTAKKLGGRRISRGDDFSRSDVDVKIPDFPMMKVDAKYRASFSHHALYREVKKKYCKEMGDIAILTTRGKHERGELVTLSMDDFSALLGGLRQLRTIQAEIKRQQSMVGHTDEARINRANLLVGSAPTDEILAGVMQPIAAPTMSGESMTTQARTGEPVTWPDVLKEFYAPQADGHEPVRSDTPENFIAIGTNFNELRADGPAAQPAQLNIFGEPIRSEIG